MRFAETQRFAGWIRAIVVLPVVVGGGLAVASVIDGSVGAALVAGALAALFAALAVPTLRMKLVVGVDERRLHIRVEAPRLAVPLLPPVDQSIDLSDIVRAEIHTYRALSDREYWGKHFWGLATGRGGRSLLYLMKGGSGVRLELRDGTRLLLGSARPHALTDVLSR